MPTLATGAARRVSRTQVQRATVRVGGEVSVSGHVTAFLAAGGQVGCVRAKVQVCGRILHASNILHVSNSCGTAAATVCPHVMGNTARTRVPEQHPGEVGKWCHIYLHLIYVIKQLARYVVESCSLVELCGA